MDKFYVLMDFGGEPIIGADNNTYTLRQVLERSNMDFISGPFDTREEAQEWLDSIME